MVSNRSVAAVAEAIDRAFGAYHARFREITWRARVRFEQRDWRGSQRDATDRLALYKQYVDQVERELRAILGALSLDRAAWVGIKAAYSRLICERPDSELAETFFNSVTRRLFSTVGVDPRIEYLDSSVNRPRRSPATPLHDTYELRDGVVEAIRRVLLACGWAVPYADLEGDARRVARVVEEALGPVGPARQAELDVLRSIFYRNKGAYLVGRIRLGDAALPLVLPLLNTPQGVIVDAALTTSDEASVVFGFAWSYFRVDAPRPRALVHFLKSLMPLKRVDELYTSIGYNKHGKTLLYRALLRHLAEHPSARFEFAEGEQGLVMSVFTLPTFNVVFKVIKDRFAAPKQTTRQAVRDKYQFVFVRDRAGRLADAQEFEHLEFARERFDDGLLAHLLEAAGGTVRLEEGRVVIRHLYTERRVTPLNVYLREAGPEAARDAVIDYGRAIKDLAASNIFTGDMLLKNFGVSRHGRVICYDYDELALLTECRFRRIPPARHEEDELAAEPWFHVGEHDVFPEEFGPFLVPPGPLREAFLAHHADLLTVEYWQAMQRRLDAGEMFDIFPYRESRRFRR
ncbi:MAG TPA: bifunctional isocitrate dehydrogenase kinase/phosphatase [Gemmatimonadales bacterium]|nr:bifunctional isocitrate dehydrogenase kinase/phosphatase [Gemmatimonadales bacterium]